MLKMKKLLHMSSEPDIYCQTQVKNPEHGTLQSLVKGVYESGARNSTSCSSAKKSQ